MILPITAYGDPVLKKKGADVASDDPKLNKLIEDMYATMYHAEGVGLAAPQVGVSMRIFIVDSTQMEDSKKKPQFKGIKKAFINPQILEEKGEEWKYEEGCLSIPGVRGDVFRKAEVKIKYQDENLEWQEEVYNDFNARVIQHEYDHIEGILFTDRLAPLKKKLIQGKLQKILKGDVDADYRMKFFNRR
jgi:peptide deformylase